MGKKKSGSTELIAIDYTKEKSSKQQRSERNKTKSSDPQVSDSFLICVIQTNKRQHRQLNHCYKQPKHCKRLRKKKRMLKGKLI